MPDVTDLARLDEEMEPLQARLDELRRQYDAVHEAVHEEELAAIDLSAVRVRTGAALRKLPGVLAALEEVLVVHDEVCDWVSEHFPLSEWGHDDYRDRLSAACGSDVLDAALEVVLARLGRVVERDVKEGDADRARAELAEIVGRAR